MERAAEPRDVHHSDHFATGWIAHDGRGACPRLDSSAEVLCRVDLDRLSDGQRGANRVRAAGELIPVRPGHEPDVLSRFERTLIARRFQNDPGRIGQDHHGPRIRQQAMGLLHDRDACIDQIVMSVLQCPEIVLRGRLSSSRAPWVDTGRMTARPGLLDHAADDVGRQFGLAQEPIPCRHDLLLLTRVRRTRESLT